MWVDSSCLVLHWLYQLYCCMEDHRIKLSQGVKNWLLWQKYNFVVHCRIYGKGANFFQKTRPLCNRKILTCVLNNTKNLLICDIPQGKLILSSWTMNNQDLSSIHASPYSEIIAVIFFIIVLINIISVIIIIVTTSLSFLLPCHHQSSS